MALTRTFFPVSLLDVSYSTRPSLSVFGVPASYGRPRQAPDIRDYAVTIDRGAKQRIVGAGTATATEPTREHKQYAIQGPTTYLCT